MASSVASRSARQTPRVDSEDAVMARAVEFATWARANARFIMTATALVLAAAAGFLYYRYNEVHRAGRAGAEFLSVSAAARSGGNESLAARDLANFANKFDGTTEADQARLMLGQIKLKNNDPKAAIPIFQKVADRSSPLQVQGLNLLGDAQAAAGSTNAAVESYRKAVDKATLQFEKVGALRDLASLYEQKGDFKSAGEAWGSMVELTEKGTADRAEFEMRQAEALAHVAGK